MRVLKHASKTTIVLSGESAALCPRISVTKQSSKLADDYHGKIRLNKKLISKFFGK